jgi:hypothetical protein
MQDQHTGLAGTFVNDPETGTRMTQEEWEAKQTQAAASIKELAPNTDKAKPKPTEEKI